MKTCDKIKELRSKANLSQQELADKIYVSRQAITKWENGRGVPDISNLIILCEFFNISLDELLSEDIALKKQIISQSKSRKWHHLIILYLVAIIIYIGYFAFRHDILMIGFLISTLFMLGIELSIFIREKIYLNK